LNYIINEEGHWDQTGYKYYLKDHLGSVRMVVNTSGTGGTIEQQTDYYPFGMTIAEYNGSIIDYRYNGKELQDDLINGKKLDWYDYRYRFYDPQICRFNSIDRLASDYPYKSPYDYAENRPVDGIDLDGLEWVNATGKGMGPVTDEYAKKNNLQLLPGFKTESQSTADQNQQVLQQAAELFPTNNTSSTGTISAVDPVQNYKDQLSAISPVSYSDGAGAIPSLTAGAQLFGLIDGGFALTKTALKLTKVLSVGEGVAKTSTSALDGSFSVSNWTGYPTGGIKPSGPFRLIEGAEYTSARSLSNSTNLAIRRANPEMLKGLQIHEIHPVKFGGSPTSFSNKIFLTPSQHAKYTNFWNSLLRSMK